MKVSYAKQSPHTAKSHGLSLQLIQMELSGFRHGFILCGTESTKIISTRYTSYSLVDLYQFLHITCVLLAWFWICRFTEVLLTLQIFSLQTHNPQHTWQNNQNRPLPLYPPASLPSHLVSRAAAPITHGASAPHGPMQGVCHQVRRCRCWFPCLGGAPMQQAPSKIETKVGPWP